MEIPSKIVLLGGRPGSGKSSLARAIQTELNTTTPNTAEHLSIGDHLRAIGRGAIQSIHAERILGNSSELQASKRLPAEIVRDVVQEYVEIRKNTPYILVDGYPRYEDEVDPFIEITEHAGAEIHGLFHLELPYEIAKNRILGRGRRESERQVDEEFADWRLNQHDTHYNLALRAVEASGLAVIPLDATRTTEELTLQVVKSIQ